MKTRELTTLKRLLGELDAVLSTLGSERTARCREILTAAQALTDDLLNQSRLPAAAVLGAKGGTQTAKRGSEYFRQLAAKRKTRAGGRPRTKKAE